VDIVRITFLVGAVVLVPAALVAYVLVTDLGVRLLPPRTQPRIRPWLWILPSMLAVTVFLIYPTIATIWLSLLDKAGQSFAGLSNYAQVLGDPGVLLSIRNNVFWLVGYTALVLVFGLILAVLADRVPYESAVKSLIFMPMAISFVAASVIWGFMFAYQPPGAPQTGTLNAMLTIFHGSPVAWLIDHRTNNVALILVAVWVWTGFAMVITSAALKGIPEELLEAARVDGATELTVFRRIIIPLLAPTLTVIGTTLVIFALKAFDIVYVMTSGNYDTNVMALRMYQELENNHNNARASALAVLLLLAIVPVLVFNVRRLRFQEAIR
jgi:alpha-glucoside transport system permease protein